MKREHLNLFFGGEARLEDPPQGENKENKKDHVLKNNLFQK